MAEELSRLEQIRTAGSHMVMHLNMGGAGHQYAFRSNLEPRITVSRGWSKERRKGARKEYYRWVLVDGVDQKFLTLEEAVMALDKLDREKANDAEWDQAERAAQRRTRPPALEET